MMRSCSSSSSESSSSGPTGGKSFLSSSERGFLLKRPVNASVTGPADSSEPFFFSFNLALRAS